VSAFTNIYNPSNNSNIKCIDLDCGLGHTILLLSDGSIWGTGLNTDGQLGTGNNTSINTFTRIYNPINNGNLQCTGITCGDSFTLYVLSDGSAWATGLNTNGQLGIGNNTTRNTFIKTWDPALRDNLLVSKVKASKGSSPSSFLIIAGTSNYFNQTAGGMCYGTGTNTNGQVGGGSKTNKNTWVLPFRPWEIYGESIPGPTHVVDVFINTNTNIRSYYLLNSGTLACSNSDGNHGGFYWPQASGINTVVTQVAYGYASNTVIILLSNGLVVGLSTNNQGQLGLNNSTNYTALIEVYQPINNSNIKCISISTSGNHVVLVLEDGSVRLAGLNTSGQLGDGTRTSPRRTFLTTYDPLTNSNITCVKAYAFPTVTILLMSNGTLRAVGNNSLAQFGIHNGYFNKLTYSNTNDINYVSGLGGQLLRIVKKNGSVWAKGITNVGQISGVWPTTIVSSFLQEYNPANNSNKKCIAMCTSNNGSSTILLDDGSTMFTGTNGTGQVGLGYTSGVFLFTISYNPANNSNIKCIAISSINNFTFIMLENGLVRGVGSNQFGQFGIGTVGGNITTFTTVYTPSNGLTCRNIYAHQDHGFLILSDGSLWGAGRNSVYELGLGNITLQNTFVKIYDPSTNSNIECLSCMCVGNYTLILLSDGSVKATGSNTNGQMGLGNVTTQTSFVTIYNPSTNSNIKCRAIYVNSSYSQLLLTDGTVLVAGLNNFGQLGNNSYTQQLTFVKMLDSTGAIMTNVYRLPEQDQIPFVIPSSPTITSINNISPNLQNPTIQVNFTQSPIDSTITNYSYSSDGITYTALSPEQFSSPLTIPVTNLTTNSSYTFSIKAINNAGSSSASTGVSATIYFPPETPTITSITAYNGIATVNFTQPTTSIAVTNYAYSYSINGGAFTEFTLCNPVKTTSPLTITGLVNNKVVSVRIRGFNDNNSVNKYSGNSNTMYNVYVYSYEPIICFKDNTKILTNNGYTAIHELRKGDLIKTFEHDFKPIAVIGKTNIKHEANQVRIPDQLYTYKQSESNNLNEDLVITGRHAILVDDFVSDEQRQDVIKLTGIIQKTDNKIHLPACVDNNSIVYETPGQYTVYHLALESEDKNTNYGIYANGLLVEACCEKYLKSRTTIEFIE
jgi:alpha-tubulin suppressor-like RCC1 family protein